MDDLAVPQHHRSGAHRARRHPLLGALATIGAVALASAVLLWALLTFDVLGVGDDLLDAGGVSGPSAAPVDVSASAPGPAGTAPAGGEPTEPGAEPTGPTTGTDAEPGPEPSADRSLPLAVLNGTSTSGLAAGAAEALEASGWTVDEVGNYAGDEIPTTVLYPEDEQQVTAEAVADDLGVGDVTPSADVDVLTVVLGPDYAG